MVKLVDFCAFLVSFFSSYELNVERFSGPDSERMHSWLRSWDWDNLDDDVELTEDELFQRLRSLFLPLTYFTLSHTNTHTHTHTRDNVLHKVMEYDAYTRMT